MLSTETEHVLRALLRDAGLVAACVGAVLFVADVAWSLAARHGRVPPVLARVAGSSPATVRRLAEITVTALLALASVRPVGASPTPVRDWLSQSTTTTGTGAPSVTTTSTTPAPTTTTTYASVPAPTSRPAPPVDARPPAHPRAPAPVPRAATYVVRPGDCLWRIAAGLLGPGATNAAVDATWRGIYAANRASIGADPNLIHPGLVLTLPPLTVTR